MVWKQDLAKLKQQLNLKPEAGPPPKPKPQPQAESRPIHEEDNMFLAAMGVKTPRPARSVPAQAPPVEALAPDAAAPEEDFGSAMSALKGMKALATGPLSQAAPAARSPKPGTPVPTAKAEPSPAHVVSEPAPVETVPDVPALAEFMGPRQIHLAAGMAVEVDGSLDLRAHSVVDGMERLKERMQDAQALGWRTLLVHLGEAEDLRDAFLDLLRGAPGRTVARYAQAPIPMGGGQAWILYFA